jgi:AraC-like DNA-binding protein
MTLLPTVCPVPQSSPWDSISYVRDIVCDRQAKRAYFVGYGSSHRLYVLCADYSKRPSPLTLFYTDPIPEPALIYPAVLTSEGQLMLAGGNICCGPAAENYNYKPSATSWLLYVREESSMAGKKHSQTVGWWGLIVLIAILISLAFLLRRVRKPHINYASNDSKELTESYKDNEPNKTSLYDRLCQLMDEEQLFLNSELRIQDVAVRLSTNSRYVSECIKTELDCTFSQFVNTYRIKYAQKLLREQSDMKLSNISRASGFSGESSFFRTFRSIVGMTPREWLDTIRKG